MGNQASAKIKELPTFCKRILIIDDDVPLANLIRKRLELEGYQVEVIHDGDSGSQALCAVEYHLAILDLNLPAMDGITVLRQLRGKKPKLPVLVLTARSALEDRVTSLDTGADDCLNKPFSFAELMARVRALLRRNDEVPPDILQVEDLLFHRDELRVSRAGRRIDLTSKEVILLEYMMRNAGKPLSRSMIMENVWGLPLDPTTNLVDVYVKYLRDKVDAGSVRKLIRTIRGVGYTIAAH